MKRLRLWLVRHWRWYRQLSLYVICDARDNSVTLSRALFDMMDVMNQEQAKVLVFRLCNTTERGDIRQPYTLYAFTLNPELGEQQTQLCDIQYNSKHRSIGFESLCPTVNRIFYDYGIPTGTDVVRLSVETGETHGIPYYIILPPINNDNSTTATSKA